MKNFQKITVCILLVATCAALFAFAAGAETDGWHNDGENGWYYVKDGAAVVNSFVKDSKGTCYAGADGYLVSDVWVNCNGWYHINENGYLDTDKIISDAGGLCLVGRDGRWIESRGWYATDGKWVYVGASKRLVTNAWIEDTKGWCHLGENGYFDVNALVPDKTGVCLLDSNGRWVTAEGWYKYGGEWVYVGANQRLKTNAWVKDGAGWCHLGADGFMEKDLWVKDSAGWCHLNAKGYRDADVVVPDTKGLCLIDKNGHWVSAEGWYRYGASWVYVGKSGYLTKDEWVKDAKGECHLGSDGLLEKDVIVSDAGGASLVDKNGYRVTEKGKREYNGAFVFVGDGGYLVSGGWVTDTNGSYHVGAGFILDMDTVIMDEGGFCLIGKDGCRVTAEGWYKCGTYWVYVKKQYLVTSSWIKYQGSWCHLNMSGIMDADTLVLDSDGYCYVNAEGYWVKETGWHKLGSGSWIYVGSDHRAVIDNWVKDENGWCHLNAFGILDTDTVVRDSAGFCYVGADGYWVTAAGNLTVKLWDAKAGSLRDYTVTVQSNGYLKTSADGKDYWRQ